MHTALTCKVYKYIWDVYIDHALKKTFVIGVFLHIMADTLGSVGVIVSTVLIKWFGWTGFDPIASIFIATLITLSVIPLIRQSTAVMMLELDDATVAAIEGTLEEVKAIDGVHSLSQSRFWPIEAESLVGSIHVQVKDDANTQFVRQQVTELLNSHIHGLKEVCVQVELYSAAKRNKFVVPQRGFFHTPVYSGVSSMNNAYINHRSAVVVPETPPTAASATIAPPLQNNNDNLLMNVLQKQTKKE